MAQKLTKDMVLSLAHLARLKLSDDEADHYVDELNTIFGYIDKLESVDTSHLQPTLQVSGLHNVMRPDVVVVNQVAKPDEMLKNVPRTKDNYIQVERMI